MAIPRKVKKILPASNSRKTLFKNKNPCPLSEKPLAPPTKQIINNSSWKTPPSPIVLFRVHKRMQHFSMSSSTKNNRVRMYVGGWVGGGCVGVCEAMRFLVLLCIELNLAGGRGRAHEV